MADFAALRRRMIDTQLVARGIRHPAVLRAMAAVPRERFVPELDAPDAYGDSALPIGRAQTISQPYIVALMLEAIAPEPTDRVLEIGTGSGYAAAVLAEMVAEVYTVERLADAGGRRSSASRRPSLPERPRPRGRRDARVARARPVRRDRRDGGRARRPGAPAPAAPGRRPSGGAGGIDAQVSGARARHAASGGRVHEGVAGRRRVRAADRGRRVA